MVFSFTVYESASASVVTPTPDSCSYSLTGVRGNFTSPDYPQHYAHNLDCSWTITVSAGYYIYLHFEHFHLEDGGSHCPFDYVQIFDGSLASNPITTKRCAYQDSWCVYSHSNVVTIVLITDGSASHPGFSAYYERVYQSYPNCSLVSTTEPPTPVRTALPTTTPVYASASASVVTPTPDSCFYNLTGLQGSFTSPDYPYYYPHHLDCTWIISVTPGYFVYLYFENFHLEGSHSNCPYDYVQIFDEENQWDPIIPKYCDYHDSWCVYSNTSVLHVRFITDGSVAYSGFIAHYQRVYYRLSYCPAIGGISTTSISPSSSSSAAPATSVSPYSSECSNHSYLEDFVRGMGYYNGYYGYYQCDSSLPFGWYRFRGAAGTEMPTSCVGKNRCSSHAPGWLDASHPSVADGAVHATVCFHWSSGCCHWSTSIRVRNCSGFYVYELGPTPGCWLRYCGNGGGNYSTSSVLTHTPVYTSASASVVTPTPGSCSYHLTHSRGNFSSPNYPNDYPLSVSCNWTISVTPGYFIYLHFEHFHLEHAYGASECPYDYVEIFDGSSSSSPLIAKRCAYQDSWCVYSTSNVLHVNFVSDVIIAQSGFSAYYERVHTRYPMCLHLNATLHSRTVASTASTTFHVTPTSSYFQAPSSIPGSCYYYLNLPWGSFASPNHPGCYPNDKYCTWLIEAPSGKYIYLYFSSFHLEYGSSYCPWDFVEIFDGNSEYSSSKIVRACGQLAPWTVYSSGRFLLVKFYSDSIIMMPGFSAFYQAVSYTYSFSLPPPQVSISSAVQCSATHTATATATATTAHIAATSSIVNSIHPTPASEMPSSLYAASSVNVLLNPSQFELHLPSDCEQICSNTFGSYTCSCVSGYQLAPDGKSCLDTDECSINNGGCSHHCFNIPGSFYCGCPEGRTMGANNLTCVEPGVSVSCGDSNMTVSLEKRTFPFFEVSQLHLRYSSCRATENDTHLLISTTLNGCGTLVNETEDALIFWNEIQADAVIIDYVITRTHDIKLPFYCSYSRRKLLSLSFTPQPIYILTEVGYGNLTFRIDFYKSSLFDTPYSLQDYPLEVELNQYIYVRYSVESSADLAIMAVTCKATKDGSFYSWPQYTIIQNGCPRDTTMDYSFDTSRSYQEFKVKTFRFFNDYETVYLHCELLACHRYSPNSRCSQGCSINKRKKRDVTRDEIEHEESTSKVILTQGPLVFKKEEQNSGETEQNKQNGALIGGTAAAGGFGLIAFVALAVLFVKYRIARRFMNRNKVGDLYTTQDEQLSRRNAYIQEDDMIEKEDAF